MSQYHWDECPYPARSQVATIRDGVIDLITANLVGVYLHGSLALGCFNPDRSDIDLLVITHRPLDLETELNLVALLLPNSAPYEPAKELRPVEISFLSWKHLHPWRHRTLTTLHYSEHWRGKVEQIFSDEPRPDPDMAAHVTIMHYAGICLHGAPVAQAFPVVPERDYVAALLYDFEGFRDHIASYPVNSILNACRVAAYLVDQQICSKETGGVWALNHLPGEYQSVVKQAARIYRGETPEVAFDKEALDAFAALMTEQIAQYAKKWH